MARSKKTVTKKAGTGKAGAGKAATEKVGKRRRRVASPKSHKRIERLALGAAALMVTIAVIGAVFQLVTGGGGPRMAPFADAPAEIRTDLLYLSYLDSLAREDRATPRSLQGAGLLPQQVAQVAGVPRADAVEWGLYPPAEAGYGQLSQLFRELHRRGRLILPLNDEPLWTHMRERKLHPGYLVFGRTSAVGEGVDFCAVLTAANIAQPEYSVLLYQDPASGALVHDQLQNLPQIAYLGGARLGDNLSGVYHRWFRLQDQRGKKPLFPH